MQEQNEPSAFEQQREMLVEAQQRGPGATLGAFVRLSGPGWLQSAITLGGGSLAGALFLGVLAGDNLLWLQLVAITMGVVMLSAIAYVTLSTGERPFQQINQHINPSLGWGWLIATGMANIIWCMPQFSLCYEALDRNLVPGGFGQSPSFQSSGELPWNKLGVSFAILVAVSVVVFLNAQRGKAAKVFDWLLKGLVGMVVICFFGVVAYLTIKGQLQWGRILAGFIPDFSQWSNPSGEVGTLVSTLPEAAQQFWDGRLVKEQRAVMIGAAATAVGINMTFLMPYSMLHRGWDKPFRGMARFDLCTGMAIPYLLVTSCVVIAAAYAFHAKADKEFLSTNPAVFVVSPTFKGAKDTLLARVEPQLAGEKYDKLSQEQQEAALAKMAALSADEKKVASSLVKRDAFALSKALAPLIGQQWANYVFGLGVFGMGFSTIIILMLINGFVFCEAAGKPEHKGYFAAGCLVAGVAGSLWALVWDGDAKMWLAILASSFGMMLLPIAYVTFFMMMNSRAILGNEKPTGISMSIWNVLMAISVAGAIVAAGAAIYEKVMDKSSDKAVLAGQVVLGILVVYVLLVVVGFFMKPKPKAT